MQMKPEQLAIVGADGLNLSLFGTSEIMWVAISFDGLPNPPHETGTGLASRPSRRLRVFVRFARASV